MKRTDINSIRYPIGISKVDRHFVRSIINSVRDFAKANNITSAIIACSGGKDSVVLADICHNVKTISGIEFILAYVNHHLRPEENGIETQFISNLANKYDFPFSISNGILPEKGNIEAEARKIRYEILGKLSRDIPTDGVFVAHHADDDFETIIMRLVDNRYTRIESPNEFQRAVYGMKQINTVYGCKIYRPLLRFKRAELQRYADAIGLTWCEDSSNQDNKFKRNRVRHYIMTELRMINPGF